MTPAPTADPPQTLELERFLPYRLSVLANTMSTAIAGAYAERFELSIPEWRVLAVLARSPGLSAAQVAARTAMDKVAVSRAVAALVRARRLERSIEESDRRRTHLRLTPRGVAVYREVVPWALAYEDAVLRGLPSRTRRKLDALLDELQRRARMLRPARMLRGPRTTADASETPERVLRRSPRE
ncbi:MAG TPA: MarR family winged helix-turn-helix transcriptional regulator [Steroidobacteraceae bacterium]|nr:MarR family winged helix-turn-helix transcriptional regulator [Steroidobacteraceae bacterium]